MDIDLTLLNQRTANKMVQAFLADRDDTEYPPSMPMLRIGQTGSDIFLTICKATETDKSSTFETILELGFDFATFLNALASVVDTDVWEFTFDLSKLIE